MKVMMNELKRLLGDVIYGDESAKAELCKQRHLIDDVFNDLVAMRAKHPEWSDIDLSPYIHYAAHVIQMAIAEGPA